MHKKIQLLVLGINVKFLADSLISPNFNTKGVIMISMALLCDAIIGNVQEKAMKTYNASNTEVVLYSYSIGCVYVFLAMLLTGDLIDGMKFCAQVNNLKWNLRDVYSNTFILVSCKDLWLCINIFFDWLFGNPNCTYFSSNLWCFCCRYSNYLS